MRKILSFVVIFTMLFNLSVIAQSDVVSFSNPAIEKEIKEALGISRGIAQSDLLNIRYLDIRGRSISDISDLTKCVNLEYLNLNYNQISDLKPLEALTKLKYITLSQNRIKDISPLKNLKNLEYLSLDRNGVTNIDSLAGLKKLVYLDIGSNSVESLKGVQDLTNLKYLDCYANKIKDLSNVQNLKGLMVLRASENLINNIEPLRGLTNLVELGMGGNDIQDYSPIKDRYDLLISDIDHEKVGRSINIDLQEEFSYYELKPEFDTTGIAYNQSKMLFGVGVSEDGANWKAVDRKSFPNQFYDGEKFVQVLDNVFSYSFDGINWVDKTIATNMENISFYEIIKAKDTYYAVGSRKIQPTTGVAQFVGLVASSKDGINWSFKEFKENQWFTSYLTDICWNGSTFVMTGEDILMSSDGVNWNVVHKSGDYESVDDVIWDGRQYVAFGGDDKEGMFTYTSTDGKNWTKKQCLNRDGKVHNNIYTRNAIWDGNNYFIVTSYELMTSKDGVIWEHISLPLFNQTALDSIFVFNNEYYLFGSPYEYIVLKSKDGFDWEVIYQPPKRSIESIVKFKGTYIGKDFDGALCYSADGVKWERVTMDSRYKFHRLINLNEKVFAYGEIMDNTGAATNIVFWTVDGLNWKEETVSITSDMLQKIIWDGKRYISLSNYGVAASEDGVNWAVISVEGLEEAIFDISFNGSKYVLLCNGNIILESEDLKKFKKHEIDIENYCTNIAWDGNRYYLTGYGEYPLMKDDYADSIINNQFYNKLQYTKVYSSADLDNWSEKSLELYSRPEQILFANGRLYIISHESLLKSEDGNNWKREYYDVMFHNMKNALRDQ